MRWYDYDKVADYLDDDDAFVEHVINGKIYPEFIICDDPWGETNNYANSKVGNDAHISWAAFLSDVKPLGNNTVKYAHILRGAMATDWGPSGGTDAEEAQIENNIENNIEEVKTEESKQTEDKNLNRPSLLELIIQFIIRLFKWARCLQFFSTKIIV